VDRTRTSLAVLPLVAGGMLVSHELAYRLTGTPGGSLHDYLEHAPQLLAVAAFAGLALAGFSTRLRRPSAWPFAVAALVAFAVQEHLERVLHTGELPWLLTSPVFLVGLLLQAPVALLAWALAHRLLAALEPMRLRQPVFRPLIFAVAEPALLDVRPAPPATRGARGPPHLRRP
jgi:hypothetical protein